MKFEEIDFYDYKIRMCLDNDIRMYLVSDLLRQYNEKHGTNKIFAHYLENKQTQELLRKRCEKVTRENSAENGQSTDHRNSDDQVTRENSAENGQSTDGRNSDHQSNEGENGKFDIPDVIQYIKTTSFGGANKGYIVCEELLHACLMWADPDFAWDVYTFLTRLRQEDNDYLKRQIDELQNQCKVLANRHVPNDNDQQWYYILSYNFKGDKVHLYSNYCRLDRMDNVIRENERKGQEEIYHLTSIPNGFAFRYMSYEDIMTVIKEYDGSPVGNQRAHFVVPRDKWDGKNISDGCSREDVVYWDGELIWTRKKIRSNEVAPGAAIAAPK